jgi:phosphoribosylformylglycinamidine cyclo-ligase
MLERGELTRDRAGCKEAECALIGGETAEMPDFYPEGEYDLAGFVVGIADKDQIIDGSSVQGASIDQEWVQDFTAIAILTASYFRELKMSVATIWRSSTHGWKNLEPTKIYVKIVKRLMRDFRIHGMAHITGGGLTENVPRMILKRYLAVIDTSSWTPPAIFKYLQEAGKLSFKEMMRTFNNGIGLVMAVKKEDVGGVMLRLKAMGESAFHLEKWSGRKEPVGLFL